MGQDRDAGSSHHGDVTGGELPPPPPLQIGSKRGRMELEREQEQQMEEHDMAAGAGVGNPTTASWSFSTISGGSHGMDSSIVHSPKAS